MLQGYRKPDYISNRFGQTVKAHGEYPRTDAAERFRRKTQRVLIADDYCIIWRGGKTFRVDDDTVTTPARYYYEAICDEVLIKGVPLVQTCGTVRCIKHWEKKETKSAETQ